MKNRIQTRLTLYITITLLVFALLAGLIFSGLFSRMHLQMAKDDLQNQALVIADTLASVPSTADQSSGGMGNGGHGMGYGMGNMGSMGGRNYTQYLTMLDAMVPGRYWVVDQNLQQLKLGRSQMEVSYQNLPEGSEGLARAALAGETVYSEDYGMFFGSPGITVATPIKLGSGEIIGAVVLNQTISSIRDSQTSVLLILLVSVGAAVVVGFIVACLMARRFTKPLAHMKTAAAKISSDDYQTRTGVSQDDEIGDLALTIDDLAGRLQQASTERERQEQQRKDFISNISHELRTPVTVIRGSLEALHDGVVSDPAKAQDYYRQMLAESTYLERMVNDLLDLAKLQNPEYSMEFEPVDLNQILADVIRSGERLAASKPLTIRYTTSTAAAVFTFQGDYNRLRQMFLIVLDNAIKFSPPESTVDVRLEGGASLYTVSIADEGPGMSDEEKQHIFDRFSAQKSEQNKSGTGLGLSIASEIARRHGIRIDVESSPGKGSTFRFRVPGADTRAATAEL